VGVTLHLQGLFVLPADPLAPIQPTNGLSVTFGL
jgi:hypothetical protein